MRLWQIAASASDLWSLTTTAMTFLRLRRRWVTGTRFHGMPCLSGASRIAFGPGFTCVSRSTRNSIGVIQRTRISVLPGSRGITFGACCGVSGAAISSRSYITIGNRVLIGSGALIMDHDAHAVNPEDRGDERAIKSAPVVIGDDVFIGARSIVLKGVHLGRGSVVAAGAVVSKSVPAFMIVAGNPARIVGNVGEEPEPT